MDNIYMILRKTLRYCYLSIMGIMKRPSVSIHLLNGHMVDWNHDNEADGERFAHLLEKLNKYCDFVNFDEAGVLLLRVVLDFLSLICKDFNHFQVLQVLKVF